MGIPLARSTGEVGNVARGLADDLLRLSEIVIEILRSMDPISYELIRRELVANDLAVKAVSALPIAPHLS